jgi:hypothetical protein
MGWYVLLTYVDVDDDDVIVEEEEVVAAAAAAATDGAEGRTRG